MIWIIIAFTAVIWFSLGYSWGYDRGVNEKQPRAKDGKFIRKE